MTGRSETKLAWFVTTETQAHHPHPIGTVVYRYDGWDYGCSSDDTRMLGREYRAFTVKEDGSGPFFTHPVNGLADQPSPSPLWAQRAGDGREPVSDADH